MRSDLSLRRVEPGTNITVARTGRQAWFVLPPQRYELRGKNDRNEMIDSAASGYAGLVGHQFKMRVTTRPYAVENWAQAIFHEFPDALPGWGKHIYNTERRILGLNLATKEVYLGVGLKVPAIRKNHAAEELAAITTHLSVPGLNGYPADEKQIEWLTHRSVCLGAPAALTLPHGDVPALAAAADWDQRPSRRMVRVSAVVNGKQVVRWVVIMTLGPMPPELSIPGRMRPWLTISDALPFPVEWSVTGEFLEPEVTKRWAQDRLHRIASTFNHYGEHPDEPVPEELHQQREHAAQLAKDAGPNPLAVRVSAWVRAAVSSSAATADDTEAAQAEVIDRAQTLAQKYLPELSLGRYGDQHDTAREFIPGEPLANTGYRRQFSVRALAKGMPQATTMIGDRVGFHLGSTSVGSSRRAFCWHPWAAMEVREQSGGTVVCGTLGCGKSTLLAILCYWALQAAIPTVGLDPAGLLARITTLPETRDHSRAVNLLNAEPGALNTYAVIADPLREHHRAERKDGMTDEQLEQQSEILYQREVRRVQYRRASRAVETIRQILPSTWFDDKRTYAALRKASRKVPPLVTSNPRMLLTELSRGDDFDRELAAEIADLAEMPQAALFFPETDETPEVIRNDYLLQILTLPGLVLPDERKPREEWGPDELLGLPLLATAADLVVRHVYERDLHQRKMTVIDELKQIIRVPTGRMFVNDGFASTRKRNHRLVVATHNITDVLGAGVGNHLDNIFAGRTEGADEQTALLKAMGIPRGVGYESELGNLSPRMRQTDKRTGFREFLVNDGDGGIGKARIDIPAAIRTAADTTPQADKARPKLSVVTEKVS